MHRAAAPTKMFRMPKLHQFSVKLISTNFDKKVNQASCIPKGVNHCRHLGASKDNKDAKPLDWDKALPYESIPGPKPLPLIGNVWRFLPVIGQYYNVPLLDLYKSLREKYGDIVVLKGMAKPPIVVVFDVNDIEKVLRNEGQYPIRKVMDALGHYRNVIRKDVFKGVSGLLALQGEEWYKFRTVVNPILMQPRTALQYLDNMDIVANELVENMRYFSNQDQNSEMPEDFQDELYKWALESVGVIALGKHLDAPKDSEAQKFIASAIEMFLLSYKLDILPPIWKYIETPPWKRFVKALDFMTETSLKYIDEAMNQTTADTPEHQLNITQRLVKQDRRLAVATVMDMIMAGIDTTGKSLAATLYFLANHPKKQQLLRKEVLKNLPKKSSPVTKEALNNSPYIKAVLKETRRISPAGVGNMRTTVKDLVLRGYRIPKNTEVLMIHIIPATSETFKDPSKFIPERWLRATEDEYSHKNAHPFAYLPFGFGPRTCIGRRLATLELEVVLLKIIRNFEISWHHENLTFGGTFLYGIQGPLRIRVKELND